MRLLTNKRGSAIIMALVTITILLVLGMAVITLSMGTLTTNVADATTNDTYYAAEAGINSAIEQVKAEVVKYYAEMSKLDGNYTSLYDNFFAGIALRSQGRFDEPDIQNMSTIHTTFSAGNINADDNTGDILISCEAIATDGTKYAVNGSVKVLRIDLRSNEEWFAPNVVLYVGNTLTLSSGKGIGAFGADIVLDNISLQGGMLQPAIYTDKDNSNVAIDDSISYPSYNNPAIDINNVYIVNNDTTFNTTSNISQPIIYGRSNLTFKNEEVKKDIYCDGIFSCYSSILSGDIHALGDVILYSGGNVKGDIYCNGNFVNYGRNIEGNVYCNGSAEFIGGNINGNVYARGPISSSRIGGNAGVVYSSTKIIYSGGASGIFFSGGDFVISNGASITGAVFALNNVYFDAPHHAWININYSQSYIDSVTNDPDNAFFFGGGSGGGGSSNTPTSDVIQGQTMTAVGRIN